MFYPQGMFDGFRPVDVRCTGSVTFRLQDLPFMHPHPQGSIHPHNIGKLIRANLEEKSRKTIDGDDVPSFPYRKLIENDKSVYEPKKEQVRTFVMGCVPFYLLSTHLWNKVILT
jgi:hypothetical protein